MPKTLYLIIFLSVVLIKSETSFGQDLKKELGICGKTMSALFELDASQTPDISLASIKDEEFCDNGRYEENANFVIYLYDAKDQLVYDKYVFLNPLSFSETVDRKNGAFKKVKFTKGTTSRIVKFPVTSKMNAVTSYKIKSISDSKTYEMKKIKW